MEYNIQEILERLRYLIKKNDTNAACVTRELGISTSSFTDWNKGKAKPGAETLAKLAIYFDVSLDWIVFGQANNKITSLDISKADELALLDSYRKLSPDAKIKLLGYSEGLAAVMPSSEDKQKLLG